jgi:hypothetical protein
MCKRKTLAFYFIEAEVDKFGMSNKACASKMYRKWWTKRERYGIYGKNTKYIYIYRKNIK